ncbi:MAG: hypothetical protein AB4426_16240 [Xenococcaceae cyanobacterium]
MRLTKPRRVSISPSGDKYKHKTWSRQGITPQSRERSLPQIPTIS